jgi:hypothetical protein
MRYLIFALLVGAQFTFTLSAHAQPPRPPGGPGGFGGPGGGNQPPAGVARQPVSAAELSSSAVTRMMALDTEGDGRLTRQEVTDARPAALPAKGRCEPRRSHHQGRTVEAFCQGG